VDPFTLIAAANLAFKGIKDLCSMYQEGKTVIKDIQKTAKEVQAIGNEVKGIFGWISSLFSSDKPNEVVQETEQIVPKKKQKQEPITKAELYQQFAKNLTAFFKAYNELKSYIVQEEEKSKNEYDPTGSVAEKAIQRVLAMSQMEAMSVELREYMIYHVPEDLRDELGALYSKINNMLGTIANEQEMARKNMLRKRGQEAWKQKQLEDKVWFRTASTIAVLFVSTYFAGLMWAIDRMTHGGM